MTIRRTILLTPGPCTTSDDVKRALVVPDICPREPEFCQVMDSIRRDLPRIANGGDEYVAVLFAASGTGAVEAALTSAVPADGKVLIIENGAYGVRLRQIAERYGIPHVCQQQADGGYPDVEAIGTLLDRDPKITHLAVVHHETSTGMLNPVDEICRLARSREKEVIVDAMSSFGGLPIDLADWRADYVVSSANKCLQGMAGLSFVIVRKARLAGLRGRGRSHYFDLYDQHVGFEGTGQMRFTPPVQIVYALRRALDLLFEETVAGRIRRYRVNFMALQAGLARLGFTFLLPDEQQSGILLAIREPRNPEYSFQSLHDYLYARGFTVYPGKTAPQATFRLAVLGDLHPPDIEQAVAAVAAYLESVRITTVT